MIILKFTHMEAQRSELHVCYYFALKLQVTHILKLEHLWRGLKTKLHIKHKINAVTTLSKSGN